VQSGAYFKARNGPSHLIRRIDWALRAANCQTIGFDHLANTGHPVWPFINFLQLFWFVADRSFHIRLWRLTCVCCFAPLRRRGFRFAVVRLGPEEVEDHAASYLAVFEPVNDFVDIRRRQKLDIGLDLALGVV
jgi:hypothetical protein